MGSSQGDEIKMHIESVVAKQLQRSPIYALTLSDVRIVSATKGRIQARTVLSRNHMNSSGGLHGSVSATIVDWAGGMAIATWDLRDKTGVSVDIHVRYLSSAKEGDEIEIEATADKVGGSVGFTSVTISKLVDGKAGPVVASGTHTKYVKVR
ncbi:HotDog domain-containing protein [Apiospora arundinis]